MVAYDPYSPEAMADPFPIYRELRDHDSVHRLEQYDAWALARFDGVWSALEDNASLSIAEGPVFERDRLLVHNEGAPAPSSGRPYGSFSTLDPPDHSRLRQVAAPAFTPRACQAMAEEVDRIVVDQLEGLEGRSRFDVVGDLAGPVAVRVVLRFLGLPEEDATTLQALVTSSTRRAPGVPGASPEAVDARRSLHRHLVERVRERRPDGVAGRYLAADAEPPLSDDEVAIQLATLLVGGGETLPKIIAGGLLQLQRHPDQRARLAADPSLAPAAFEEMVRLEGVLQFVGRTVVRETTIAGQRMSPGQRVLLLLQSANRDERAFESAESFRLDRPLPRHVGFGHGVHFCIGVHAARVEGVAILRRLLERHPEHEIDLSGAERPPSEFQIGWTRMPLVVS